MSHKRKAIRHAMRDTLLAVPSLSGRVFTTRTRPTEIKELPVVIIYALDETAERTNYQGALSRPLTVAVEVRTNTGDDMDDALDDLCGVVEAALAGDRLIKGLAMDSVLSATTIGLDGEGEGRQGIATLRYNVRYQTDARGQ